MSYTGTTIIEVIGGEINRTPIAFPNTTENTAEFETWCHWDEWVSMNKVDNGDGTFTLPDHLMSPFCYEGSFEVESIEGLTLTIVETL